MVSAFATLAANAIAPSDRAGNAFGARLETDGSVVVAPEVERASVPSLFVQPLVENAIRHGISRRSSGGTVIVSAERVANRLDFATALKRE